MKNSILATLLLNVITKTKAGQEAFQARIDKGESTDDIIASEVARMTKENDAAPNVDADNKLLVNSYAESHATFLGGLFRDKHMGEFSNAKFRQLVKTLNIEDDVKEEGSKNISVDLLVRKLTELHEEKPPPADPAAPPADPANIDKRILDEQDKFKALFDSFENYKAASATKIEAAQDELKTAIADKDGYIFNATKSTWLKDQIAKHAKDKNWADGMNENDYAEYFEKVLLPKQNGIIKQGANGIGIFDTRTPDTKLLHDGVSEYNLLAHGFAEADKLLRPFQTAGKSFGAGAFGGPADPNADPKDVFRNAAAALM